MQIASSSICRPCLSGGQVRQVAAPQIVTPRLRARSRTICASQKSNGTAKHAEAAPAAPKEATSALAAVMGVLTPLMLDVQAASAHDPLLEGRTVSLVHPAMMFFLFGSTLYTGWLGLQWRCDG